jgi:hypothetical protein
VTSVGRQNRVNAPSFGNCDHRARQRPAWLGQPAVGARWAQKLLWVEIVFARFIHDSDEPSGRDLHLGDMLVQPAHQERGGVALVPDTKHVSF